MRLSVTGRDTLGVAVATCCARFFPTSLVPAVGDDVLWVCYDTAIGPDGAPDVDGLSARISEDLDHVGADTVVVVSSQIPVGTIARLESEHPGYTFVCVPENVRAAYAIPDFTWQRRIVVGRREGAHDGLLTELLSPFTDTVLWTDPETAEMTKHAINCWLGLQIAFINEIARVSAVVGADAAMVARGLMTDRRVSPEAPLKPGAPYGGGHLARDIYSVNQIVAQCGLHAPILQHIKASNDGVPG